MKIFKYLAVAGLSGLATFSYTTKKPSYEAFQGVKYVSNYDGDTILVDIDGLPPLFGKHISVRVAHIDTPEITGVTDCEQNVAKEAKTVVEAILTSAKTIELVDPKRDKYFRILADVLIDGKRLLSKTILDMDLAVPYEGGEKEVIDWCLKNPQK